MRAFLGEFFLHNVGIPVPDFDKGAILGHIVWSEGLELDKVHVFHAREVGLLKQALHVLLRIICANAGDV
jgi:hypothetical protein